MSATASIDTPERSGQTVLLPLAAATLIYAGVLVAINSAGNAVNAADTAALRVIGRAEETVDNTAGAAGDLSINVKRGVFKYANSGTQAVDADDKGKVCFVEDNQTVAETSTNKLKAGRVLDVESDGVWIDTHDAQQVTAVAADGTTDGNFTTYAASATSAADLAALKVVVNAMAVELEKLADLTRLLRAAGVARGDIA